MGFLAYIMRRLISPLVGPPRLGRSWLVVGLLVFSPVAGHAELLSSENSLKAAFILNFAKMVEWPEAALRGKTEFCIASLGRTSLQKELAGLNGMSVQGHSVVVRQYSSPKEAAKCQVLFIASTDPIRLEGILDALRNLPVLTVSDHEGFCGSGGMVSLVSERERVAFEVNLQEMQRSKLKPSSHLLKLARKIYGLH